MWRISDPKDKLLWASDGSGAEKREVIVEKWRIGERTFFRSDTSVAK